jgi:hypothetical protein
VNGDGTTELLSSVVVTVMPDKPEASLFCVIAPSLTFDSVTAFVPIFAAVTAPSFIFECVTALE